MMETITFHAASTPGEDLAPILADYLALEEARAFRRLFVTRFGLLALAVFVSARIIPGFSAYAHWVPVTLCLAPPLWAWIAEIRIELRLATRLADADRKKVIKSS